MNGYFPDWLAQNGLVEAFVTSAGDALYVNQEKRFGVLKKFGEYGVHSFYLDDIVEYRTFDDENLITEWNCWTSWRMFPKSNRYSTNEVYINIRLNSQLFLRIQLFRATHGNIERDSYQHIGLYNYACQISQIVYNLIHGL